MGYVTKGGRRLNPPIKYMVTNEQVSEGVKKYIQEGNSISALYDYDIVFFGDSLTAGVGGEGTSFPSVMCNALGITNYLNKGIAGATTFDVACIQGGDHAVIPANIDLSTPFTLADAHGITLQNLYLSYADGTFIGETASGLISVDQKTYKMEDSVIYKSPKYVSSGFAKSHTTYKSMVVMLGTNDGIQLITGDTNAYMAAIKDMVEHYGGNQYLILGVPNTQYGYGNNLLKKEYGARYFDTIEYMSKYAIYEAIDQGLLSENVLTEEVLSEIEATKIPSPLRSDWLHMNALGYTLLGNKITEKFVALGYQP